MASELSFVEHIVEQARDAGSVSFRKMFGEYAIYVGPKVVALVCDDQLFLKPTDAARALLPKVKEGSPYPGAKPCYVIDAFIDNRDRLSELFRVTAAALLTPKPKKPKKTKGANKKK